MANTNEIRQHITAVEQTSKITGAMEMVSSNRMRRVMSHIEYNKEYFEHIRRAMREILSAAEGLENPYLTRREGSRRTYVAITSDKGLCGSYNSSIIELTEKCLAEYPDSMLITVGQTGGAYFRRRGRPADIALPGLVQDPTMKTARRMSQDIITQYDKNEMGEIHFVYMSFYGETKNTAVELRMLPIVREDYADVEPLHKDSSLIYHPSPEAVFDELVPQYVLGLVFGIMVQAYASEHFARMNAMHASTQNANDMLKALTTQYNMARQSTITNELAEITGAAEILRGGV